jgi:hypothetical protein
MRAAESFEGKGKQIKQLVKGKKPCRRHREVWHN